MWTAGVFAWTCWNESKYLSERQLQDAHVHWLLSSDVKHRKMRGTGNPKTCQMTAHHLDILDVCVTFILTTFSTASSGGHDRCNRWLLIKNTHVWVIKKCTRIWYTTNVHLIMIKSIWQEKIWELNKRRTSKTSLL